MIRPQGRDHHSALVAAEVMAELHPASPILAVGDVGLFEALGAKNLDLVDDDVDRATVVVMGKDPNFDQNRLNVVCKAIWNGAKFFATNYDPRLPVAGGFVPATGPMVKAVAYAMGRNPGMRTVLVLTGTADASDVDDAPPEQQPSVVVDGVGDLIPWLDADSTAE